MTLERYTRVLPGIRRAGVRVMETHEALAEAGEFLKDFPADSFDSPEKMVAAAILWGERLGIQRTRSNALHVMAEARAKLFA